ncbi:SipW-dependent-type signal peptide-containing protein [Agromyces terreus]|uniref:SipW-dependent-type signal peptide-containing protein n=1 Tax=Agromyces terreus TaxID=424795 RepID=UPI0031DA9394
MTEPGPDARRPWVRRRILAVLAGGLVLGAGTATTLAAWTDTEYATGTITASVFDTESQGSGDAAYASRPAAPGAVLAFDVAPVGPGSTRYAWVRIRTTGTTTVDGGAQLAPVTATGGLAPVLSYRAVVGAAPGACAAPAFAAGATFIAGGPSTSIAAGAMPPTPVSFPLGAAAASPQEVCVEVTVAAGAANSYQGTSATLSWQFTAQSAE